MSPRRYGWVPDVPDRRDVYRSVLPGPVAASVDLGEMLPPVLDQGDLGSCTAHAISSAIMFDQKKQGAAKINQLSRLFIYYNERVMEHTVSEDCGAQIRDGIKVVNKMGVCCESFWPYDASKFATKPGSNAFEEAKKHRAVAYERIIPILSSLCRCLTSGFPIVLGISIYESFESDSVAASGIVPIPAKDERSLGGHAVLCFGYTGETGLAGYPHFPPKHFIVRNSWGEGWGVKGNFAIPYDYLTNRDLADDFWTIRTVTE